MAAKRQAVGPVASSRNMQGIESVWAGGITLLTGCSRKKR